MAVATIQSGTLQGIEAFPVNVEVNTGQWGEPKLVFVGLPDKAVKESNDRVLSAVSNSGFGHLNSRTTINLAPGHIRKEGPAFDLPIAIAYLEATQKLATRIPLDRILIAGELSLAGFTRPIRGGLSLGILAKKLGVEALILPEETAHEASLIEGLNIYAVQSLDETHKLLEHPDLFAPLEHQPPKIEKGKADLDFADVKGQTRVRRATEIAVSGAHNILIIGDPGSGKSMIAKRIPSIIPPPSLDEYLEVLAIHSAAGIQLNERGKHQLIRPFRSPHHTISDVGLLGGGSIPGPGEISLAHNGVLFLDELPEFRRSTLEVLRQPMEDRTVTISRSSGKITLPSSFMLVAAMNPTPSGYSGKNGHQVPCSLSQIQKYRSKISGPLLDRIDIHVEAAPISFAEIQSKKESESSQTIRERVIQARKIQERRFQHEKKVRNNAQMESRHIRQYCQLNENEEKVLKHAMEKLKLSARAYDRILKVSRTIADLKGNSHIDLKSLTEAIQYRALDRDIDV